MKRHATITLDEDLLEKSQKINLSGVLNSLLRRYLDKPEEMSDEEKAKILQEQKKEERYDKLLNLCEGFWRSPWGKETINKSRLRKNAPDTA